MLAARSEIGQGKVFFLGPDLRTAHAAAFAAGDAGVKDVVNYTSPGFAGVVMIAVAGVHRERSEYTYGIAGGLATQDQPERTHRGRSTIDDD